MDGESKGSEECEYSAYFSPSEILFFALGEQTCSAQDDTYLEVILDALQTLLIQWTSASKTSRCAQEL